MLLWALNSAEIVADDAMFELLLHGGQHGTVFAFGYCRSGNHSRIKVAVFGGIEGRQLGHQQRRWNWNGGKSCGGRQEHRYQKQPRFCAPDVHLRSSTQTAFRRFGYGTVMSRLPEGDK